MIDESLLCWPQHDAGAVICDPELSSQLKSAAYSALKRMEGDIQDEVPTLMSGAGHDAMAISHLTKVTFLLLLFLYVGFWDFNLPYRIWQWMRIWTGGDAVCAVSWRHKSLTTRACARQWCLGGWFSNLVISGKPIITVYTKYVVDIIIACNYRIIYWVYS